MNDRARYHLDALRAHLRELRGRDGYAPSEDGGFTDAAGEYTCESSPAADEARAMARELLEVADANGLHGCRLCQS